MQRVGVSKWWSFTNKLLCLEIFVLVTKFNTRFAWGPFDHQWTESQNQVLQETVNSLNSVMHTKGRCKLEKEVFMVKTVVTWWSRNLVFLKIIVWKRKMMESERDIECLSLKNWVSQILSFSRKWTKVNKSGYRWIEVDWSGSKFIKVDRSLN